MDLEKVALEAVKVKIQEIFDEIIVSTAMDGKDIVIRISLPFKPIDLELSQETKNRIIKDVTSSYKDIANLDKEAQAAADELLGTNPQERA